MMLKPQDHRGAPDPHDMDHYVSQVFSLAVM